jgi:hypothetical protein
MLLKNITEFHILKKIEPIGEIKDFIKEYEKPFISFLEEKLQSMI